MALPLQPAGWHRCAQAFITRQSPPRHTLRPLSVPPPPTALRERLPRASRRRSHCCCSGGRDDVSREPWVMQMRWAVRKPHNTHGAAPQLPLSPSTLLAGKAGSGNSCRWRMQMGSRRLSCSTGGAGADARWPAFNPRTHIAFDCFFGFFNARFSVLVRP